MRGTNRAKGLTVKVLLLLMLLLALALLTEERWRGKSALKAWNAELSAKGEMLELPHRLLHTSSAGIEFSNQFARACEELPQHLGTYSQVTGIILEQPGTARRGSQESGPIPASTSVNSWQDLDKTLQESEDALKVLRDLLRNPAAKMGYQSSQTLEEDSIPNFVGFRRSAQALHAAVINDLHKHDLAHAVQNLSALLSFKKLNAEDSSLVNLMIRIAIMGLAVDASWDALQEKGWTDDQLVALQHACEGDAQLVAQLPRALETERIARHYRIKWFRTHFYGAIVTRFGTMYESFGWRLPEVGLRGQYRRWIFHPLWSIAWADQEELLYSGQLQLELQALRSATQRGSWIELQEQLDHLHSTYKAPVASWRFYGKLPLAEEVPGESDNPKRKTTPYPCADFSRAWFTGLKNITLNEMALTVMAIKRYELLHDKPPPSLSALVPKFLTMMPRDFMNGQTLRYRVRADGSFLLYSQGQDGKDQQGDPRPELIGSNSTYGDAWSGRDWVWPQCALEYKPADD